ncbi:MAG: DUF2088 domain-containing protein [Deltaproteobacteria bacterium]|nr:DUF2088 domain-containing protein [Deltaproteobacteria bacterium]
MQPIQMRRINQVFEDKKIEDIPGTIVSELQSINFDSMVKPGMQIGITVGSRGIRNIQTIIRTIIEEVKKRGAKPFIITAMGSHGGATAEGQRKVLEKYGFTEASMGVPIKATMDVVELGTLDNGLTVYFDKIAYESDGIIAVNRVKVHTGFKSNIESGLHKILAVGLGNHKGASLVHALGVKGLKDYMVEFADVILNKAPILCGIGILENAYDETYRIVAAAPDDFKKVDTELLRECKAILPHLPVRHIDILIVQEMGKNISGTGMDTNIVGGILEYDPEEYTPPQIKRIIVLDLTDETAGNALGIGRADLITRRVYDRLDLNATYTNTITATFLERAKIPIVMDTEKEAFEVALKTIWNLPGTTPRVMIIKNTLRLDELYVSEPIWEEIDDRPNVKATGDWIPLTFDSNEQLQLKL